MRMCNGMRARSWFRWRRPKSGNLPPPAERRGRQHSAPPVPERRASADEDLPAIAGSFLLGNLRTSCWWRTDSCVDSDLLNLIGALNHCGGRFLRIEFKAEGLLRWTRRGRKRAGVQAPTEAREYSISVANASVRTAASTPGSGPNYCSVRQTRGMSRRD